MVYRHRTKSGKIKHYQSYAHYQKSMKGLFGNNYKKQSKKPISKPNIQYSAKQLKQTQKPIYSGKVNLSASLRAKAKHKPHENKFLLENNWKTAKREHLYVNVDGALRKYGDRENYSVDGLYIADALTAKDIQSIHNHPSPHPPSDRDIFDLLY